MADAPEGKRIVFPPEPEVPRFLYAGQLVGESNFRREGGESGLSAVWHAITGVFAGEAAPVVLQRPQSGAVDQSGRIFVSDVSRAAVYVFDEPAGELLVWEQADGLRRFASPIGVAPGADGDLFVADADLGIVAHLDPRGNPLPPWGKGILARPTGVAFDPARRQLFVADTYAHDVKVFGPDGRLERTIGARGEEADRFNFPTYIALWNGELYVSDSMNARIVVMDVESGNVLREIGTRGLRVGNLVRPKGVAVDADGNVYIVESYYDHLLVFSNNGEFLLPIGGAGKDTGQFFLPSGTWADAQNRIFVADTFNGRVMVFQFMGGEGENLQ